MKISKFGREMREEGWLEGRLEAKREDILIVLKVSFGAGVYGEFETALNAITNFDRLHRLFQLTMRITEIDDFRQALANGDTTPA